MKKDSYYDTPFGRGLLYNTKDNVNKTSPDSEEELPKIHCMKLEDITLADGKHPTLYTCQNNYSYCKPRVGDDVVLGTIGRGFVKDIRRKDGEEDDIVQVELRSWRLAGRSCVQIYAPVSAFVNVDYDDATTDVHHYIVVRKNRVFEMDIYERIEHAKELKKKAIPVFVTGDYVQALNWFAQAVHAVRMQQHSPDSTNEMRADLVEIMITCSNNSATCNAKLNRWEEAQQNARNALLIIDALENKRGLKVHKTLRQGGLSDLKIFGEWRIKSLLIIARAEGEQQEYSMAIVRLKKALSITRAGSHAGAKVLPQLAKQDLEIRRLIQSYGERQKLIFTKEKARAKAMFGNASTSTKKDDNTLKTDQSHNEKKHSLEKSPTQTEGGGFNNDAPVQKSHDKIEDIKECKDVDTDTSYNESEEEDFEATSLSWHEEHREALILSGIGALALVGFSFMFKGSRGRL